MVEINRHVKRWFRLYAEDFPFCKGCRSLPDYMETSDDSPETFPEETKYLQHLSNLVLPYTSDGSFMQCSRCNAYYWYRSFAPGGSEDAMYTTVYETISKTGLLGVYMELQEALEVSSEYYRRYEGDKDKTLYEMYLEEYRDLQKEAGKHLDYINKHATVLIKDALVCLKAHGSAKDNKYYKEDLIPAEELAAKFLLQFLKQVERKPFVRDLKILLKHPNKKVADLISEYL